MTAAHRYTNVQAATASPQRLMMLLFDAALRHMKQGRGAVEQGNYSAAITSLDKAAEIVLHLEATMKPNVAPELCEKLTDIYRFVVGRLSIAATGQDPKAVQEAERALAPVVDAFRQVCAAETAAPQARP